MEQLIFGELDGRRSPRLEQLLAACASAKFKSTLSENIQVDIWTKFVRLSVFSGMTSVTRCPIGAHRERSRAARDAEGGGSRSHRRRAGARGSSSRRR